MRRFVFLIAWQSDREPDAPRGIVRAVIVGLAALGVAAVIVWRIVAA